MNDREQATQSALHDLENIKANVTIVKRRLTRTGSSVPPEAANAHILVHLIADLIRNLTVIEETRS
jgi:hypothetical protein